jgi:hypothetical protein
MGLWDGLKSAQVFEKGAYLGPGTYDAEIVRILTKQTQKSGLGFIVELKVINSNNPEHKPGSKASWFQSMKSPPQAFAAIKEFVAAVLGIPAKEKDRLAAEIDPIIEKLMDRLTGAENAFGPQGDDPGRMVHVETFMKKTQRGGDFTVHAWSPYTGGLPRAGLFMAEPPPLHGLARSAQALAAPQPPPPPVPRWDPTKNAYVL